MNKTLLTRIIFLITAITSIGVVPVKMILAYQNTNGEFNEPIARAVNTLMYFTNQVNILVGVVSLLLFLNIKRDSELFNVARFTGFVSIIVVAAVYWTLIAPTEYLEGLAIVTNQFVHTINPILYVLGWLVFGPRKRTSWKIVGYSLIYPIVWVIFTMIKGAFVDYYPYNFLDVRDLGYKMALINIGGVTVLFLLLFAGAHLLDKSVLSKIGHKS